MSDAHASVPPVSSSRRGDSAARARDFVAVARGADLVVIRVVGRGNMITAPALAEFAEEQRKAGFCRFVFDLERCVGLDSTFMGVMVGIHTASSQESGRMSALAKDAPPPEPHTSDELVALTPEEASRELAALLARKASDPLVTAVNVTADVKALMSMLGVDAFVKVRGSCDLTQLETTILPERTLDPDERRRLILKAHETLVEIDQRNEAQFGAFLKQLSSELSREK